MKAGTKPFQRQSCPSRARVTPSGWEIGEGTEWAQKGHKIHALHGFPASYMAAKSLNLLVTTGLTKHPKIDLHR